MARNILGDPGADSKGEEKSKQAEKTARRRVKNVEKSLVPYFSSRPFFPARLDFPSPLLWEDGHEIEQGQSQDEPNRKGEIYWINNNE